MPNFLIMPGERDVTYKEFIIEGRGGERIWTLSGKIFIV